MNKIKLLDKNVSNMIAAGEVVERPASVVKELLENSIDAGAKNITVEIKSGGIKYIRISDDGSGMSAEDAKLSIVRHATSKISKGSDLDAIMTLGFRGEALASISSVSVMEMYTKTADEEIGTYIKSEAGEITDCHEAGCPKGTTITVRDLFKNVPARMKFLKKDYTEAGYIEDITKRLALARPDISVRFINNDKEQLFTSGNDDLSSCIFSVYGKEVKSAMRKAEYREYGISVSGYCAGAEVSRPNRNMQNFFINGRYIKSPLISRATEEAYKQEMMTGKFPVCVLNVDIDPHFVDINVHPTKLEAKFSDEKAIYHVVYWAVKNALCSQKAVFEVKTKEKEEIKTDASPVICAPQKEEKPKTEFKEASIVQTEIGQAEKNKIKAEFIEKDLSFGIMAQKPAYTLNESKAILFTVNDDEQEEEEHPLNDICKEVENTEKTIESKEEIKEEASSLDEPPKQEKPLSYKICGQVFDTYIIVEKDGEMLMIDQHAAHERLRFEELRRQYKNRNVVSQLLIAPHIAELTPTEMANFEECRENLSNLGFDADVFGEREIIIRSVPQVLAKDGADITAAVLEVIDAFSQHKIDVETQMVEKLLYSISCRGAIKANHKMCEEEMKALLDRVLTLPDINTCPHGRPITITFTKEFIEKQFRRIV